MRQPFRLGRGLLIPLLPIFFALFGAHSALAQSESAKLTGSTTIAGDRMAQGIAASGARMISGATVDDLLGGGPGSAFIFEFDEEVWSEEAVLLASDGDPNDRFGISVAMDGDVAVVGAHKDDDAGTATGSAYVFRYDGTAWTEEQKLLASDAAADAEFGVFVSVRGDVALVGAHLDDGAGFSSGAAYVDAVDNIYVQIRPGQPWGWAFYDFSYDMDDGYYSAELRVNGGAAQPGEELYELDEELELEVFAEITCDTSCVPATASAEDSEIETPFEAKLTAVVTYRGTTMIVTVNWSWKLIVPTFGNMAQTGGGCRRNTTRQPG